MHASPGIPEPLPFDLETERCVLGSILRDPRCLPEVAAHLRPDDFYADRHQSLFELMERMEERNPGHCDAVSVGHEVERAGRGEELGGKPYLVELMAAVPSIAFLENHIRIIRDLAMRRGLISAADSIQRMAVSAAENEDVETLVNRAGRELDSVGDRLAGNEMESIKQIVDGNLDKILNMDGQPQGLQTDFLDLDAKQGFRAGDLIVLAARPGMGKTAFALNLLERVALKSKKSILFFSLEMPNDQIMMRLLAAHARIPHDSLRRGKFSSQERQRLTVSAGNYRSSGIYIDDSSQPSLAQIRAKARRLRRDGKLDLIIIDYLQLLNARAESRQNEIALISRTLKSIAKDLRVPVLALAQLNRKAEERSDHRPMLSDLRESGAIEQDADMVMMLMREEYYGETEENREKAQIIIAKNRHGSTGEFTMKFTKRFMRFDNFSAVGDVPAPAAPVFD